MAIRYPEISSLNHLYEEINRIFRELCQFDPAAERALETMEIPPLDIYETEDEVVMELEMPGVDPDKVSASFHEGKLTIEGLKEEWVEKGRTNYICMERSFGRFQRIIPITTAVNIKAAMATYDQGILTIKVPKLAEKRGGKTAIEIVKIADSEEPIE